MKLAELQKMNKPLTNPVLDQNTKFDIEYRSKAVKYQEQNSTRAASEKFDVAQSTIRIWMQEKKDGHYDEYIFNRKNESKNG